MTEGNRFKRTDLIHCLLLGGLALLCSNCGPNTLPEFNSTVDWSSYLGDPATSHYSPLSEIDRDNVGQLEVAWMYRSGDADGLGKTQIQCNPLIIDGVLYGSTPTLDFFALNAENGEELWRFSPPVDPNYDPYYQGVNRGMAYWADGKVSLLLVTAGPFLLAIDARSGQLIPSFGEQGRVDLRSGLDRPIQEVFWVSNTPGVVYQDRYILGGRVLETPGAAPGYIRAYNVRSGAIEWTFKTIPKPGEPGYETWPPDKYLTAGGANAWAGMSLDTTDGTVFIPTGSAAYDYYGGDRRGENLYANCIVALDAATGQRRWHFQTVHHDLWDRDLPCPPNLVTIQRGDTRIPAIAQPTKSGYVFLLDRQTGEPIFPIEETPVPTAALPGEAPWPTQPIPTQTPPFMRTRLDRNSLTERTSAAAAAVRQTWDELAEFATFGPPSAQGRIIFPGLDGGAEWGGAAYDAESGLLYLNANEVPWVMRMLPNPTDNSTPIAIARGLYVQNCATCHGTALAGNSRESGPSLLNLKERLSKTEVQRIISVGRNNMPAFPALAQPEVEAIAAYLLEEEITIATATSSWPLPYYHDGYQKFMDPDGYPAIKPPWGTLTAIDLNKGEIVWRQPLGEYPELSILGIPPTGTENYGGPLVTAGGLLFIGATPDGKFRVFDKKKGTLLWETQLPAAGFATPATYAINGKQYVVLACGGGKLGRPSGDMYLAFSLPTKPTTRNE